LVSSNVLNEHCTNALMCSFMKCFLGIISTLSRQQGFVRLSMWLCRFVLVCLKRVSGSSVCTSCTICPVSLVIPKRGRGIYECFRLSFPPAGLQSCEVALTATLCPARVRLCSPTYRVVSKAVRWASQLLTAPPPATPIRTMCLSTVCPTVP